MSISVGDAASRLGVSAARVRALIKAGEFRATRPGTEWLLEPSELERWERTRSVGRPLSARVGWATAALLDDKPAPWVTDRERSRIRARLKQGSTLDQWAALLRRRAVRHRYRIDERGLSRLLVTTDVVRGGISHHLALNSDLNARGQAELYISAGHLTTLAGQYALLASEQPNLLIHSVEGDFHTMAADSNLREVPSLIACVDLFDSDDPRRRRAAQDFFRGLKHG